VAGTKSSDLGSNGHFLEFWQANVNAERNHFPVPSRPLPLTGIPCQLPSKRDRPFLENRSVPVDSRGQTCPHLFSFTGRLLISQVLGLAYVLAGSDSLNITEFGSMRVILFLVYSFPFETIAAEESAGIRFIDK
jgi:hypothetical protein